MSLKIALLAAAALVGATTISLAQSLPNYGPNAPANADSFGQPPSGAMPPGVPRSGYRAYGYNRHWHHHYRYRHHRHWYW
jgi:hypothetical protein